MNRIKRNLAIAGVAGATILGGLTVGTTISAAQTDSSSEAPAPGTDEAPNPDRPADCGPGRRHGPNLEAAASAIGVEVDELREALRNGSTLAQVAEEHGVDPQTVIDAMVAEAQAHLAEKVTSGEITQEEADEKLANVTERITDLVQNGKPERPEGPPPAEGSEEAPADAPGS